MLYQYARNTFSCMPFIIENTKCIQNDRSKEICSDPVTCIEILSLFFYQINFITFIIFMLLRVLMFSCTEKLSKFNYKQIKQNAVF